MAGAIWNGTFKNMPTKIVPNAVASTDEIIPDSKGTPVTFNT